jgi:hypothetical protein
MQKAETLREPGIRKEITRFFQRVKPWSGWRCRTERNCPDNHKREGSQKCGVALKEERASKAETLREPVSGSGMKYFQHGWTTFWREQTSGTEPDRKWRLTVREEGLWEKYLSSDGKSSESEKPVSVAIWKTVAEQMNGKHLKRDKPWRGIVDRWGKLVGLS